MQAAQDTDTLLWRWRVALTLLSVALFLFALTRPAFFWGQSASSSGPAGRVLLQGWKGLTSGYIEWLANPLLLIAWMLTLRGRRSLSRVSAALTVALMLAFLSRHSLRLPGGAGGSAAVTTGIAAYGSGYWLWLASGVVSLIAGFR